MANALPLLLVLLFLLPNVATAAPRITWHADLSAATRESKADSKPLLVKFSTSWCGYCVKMQRETFSDRAIIGQVEECFVPVSIDGDQHRDLVQRLGIQSFPTTLIVSSDMKVVKKIVGFRSADQLTVDLVKACERPEAASTVSVATPSSSRRLRRSVFGKLCPVTLGVQGVAADGDLGVTQDYEGYRLAFKTQAHRDEFNKNPKRYWPVVDGVCVVSALDESNVRFGDLAHALKYQGRSWLFVSEDHKRRFERDPEHYLQRLRAMAAAKRSKQR